MKSKMYISDLVKANPLFGATTEFNIVKMLNLLKLEVNSTNITNLNNIVNKLTVKNLIKLFCLVILFTPIDTIFADSHSPVYGGKLKSALASEGIRGFETWKDTTATETHIYSVMNYKILYHLLIVYLYPH